MEKAKAWVAEHKKASARTMERRYVESVVQMNFRDQKKPTMEGYAAVFGKRAELFPGFFEEIAPGAFTEAIRSEDIYALWNHNPSDILGNTGAGTLRVAEDDHGLRSEIVPPDTTLGRDLQVLIKRGDVRKMSFGFNIEDEKNTRLKEGKGVLRTILKVKPLFDVSPVTYPAYKETEVHVRMIRSDSESFCLLEDKDEVIPLSDDPKIELSDAELWKQFEEIEERLKRR